MTEHTTFPATITGPTAKVIIHRTSDEWYEFWYKDTIHSYKRDRDDEKIFLRECVKDILTNDGVVSELKVGADTGIVVDVSDYIAAVERERGNLSVR